MDALVRFIKVMLFVGVLAMLGPLLILAAILIVSGGGAHLRPDVSYEEIGRTLGGALGMWFAVMFLVGFISFITGLPNRFKVAFADGRDAFRARMDAAARSVRYRRRVEDGSRVVYKPPVYAFLAEKVTADIGENSAEISAPFGLKKKLLKKLAAGA